MNGSYHLEPQKSSMSKRPATCSTREAERESLFVPDTAHEDWKLWGGHGSQSFFAERRVVWAPRLKSNLCVEVRRETSWVTELEDFFAA